MIPTNVSNIDEDFHKEIAKYMYGSDSHTPNTDIMPASYAFVL